MFKHDQIQNVKNFNLSWLRRLISIAAMIGLSSCGAAGPPFIATMTHDFNGDHTLFSFPAEPINKVESQNGDILSTRLPVTLFVCVWRNPSHKKTSDKRPAEIFLSCVFSARYISNKLEFLTADRGQLKANWVFKNGDYQLNRFEVEIQQDRKSFRSQNLERDMPEIQVVANELVFPKHENDTFTFRLKSTLPHRLNSGNKIGQPVINLSFSGTAEPIPNWLNY